MLGFDSTTSGSIAFDTSSPPVVVVRMACSSLSDADVERFVARFTRIIERGEQFVSLIDTRGMRTVANARQRRTIAAWIDDPRLRELSRRYKLADAVVVSNPLVRSAVAAVITWMVTPVSPLRVFATPLDAEPWLAERLRAAGIASPDLHETLARI